MAPLFLPLTLKIFYLTFTRQEKVSLCAVFMYQGSFHYKLWQETVFAWEVSNNGSSCYNDIGALLAKAGCKMWNNRYTNKIGYNLPMQLLTRHCVYSHSKTVKNLFFPRIKYTCVWSFALYTMQEDKSSQQWLNWYWCVDAKPFVFTSTGHLDFTWSRLPAIDFPVRDTPWVYLHCLL